MGTEPSVLGPGIRGRLAGKRLVFTVTTGRSGSGYLTSLLERLPGVAATHEPEPRFSSVMRAVQADSSIATRFWVEQKLPAIAGRNEDVYVETSHLFCKGFFEPLLDLGFVPDLIVLTREKRSTAKSLYLLDQIPGSSEWHLSPADRGTHSPPRWQDLHPYQLCYWYCLEIERRSVEYARQVTARGGVVARIDLAELATLPGVDGLIRQLRLPSLPLVQRVRLRLRNSAVNQKMDAKKKRDRFGLLQQIDFDALERELDLILDANHVQEAPSE